MVARLACSPVRRGMPGADALSLKPLVIADEGLFAVISGARIEQFSS